MNELCENFYEELLEARNAEENDNKEQVYFNLLIKSHKILKKMSH